MPSTRPDAAATDVLALIERLAAGGVEFILIGGVAAAVHGSAHIIDDLVVLYRRTSDNIQRLAAALEPLHYRRGAVDLTGR